MIKVFEAISIFMNLVQIQNLEGLKAAPVAHQAKFEKGG
jgi:hypothetical protein